MKERPILFSAPMVRAILAGTKTQTRRVLPTMTTLGRVEYPGRRDHKGYSHVNWLDTPDGIAAAVRECRHGQPGDRLWVRETFSHFERNDQLKRGAEIFYRADGECLELEPWRPSIHMPRWASRITLEIISVRVERLKDISDADARDEGAEPRQPVYASGIYIPGQYRLGFRDLWQSINGAGSWTANPWVWVVEFKRVEAAQ